MIRSGLSALLILSAALLLCGFDWKQGVSAPFKKSKNAIVNTGKKITGNNADPASANIEGENNNFDFVIEINGKRRAEGHREYKVISYKGLNCREAITHKLYTIKRNETEFTSTVYQRVITGPKGEALFLEEVTEVAGKRERLEISIGKGLAKFESIKNGKTEVEKVAVPNGVLFSITSHWLVSQELETGNTLIADVLSQRLRKVVQATATVLDQTNSFFNNEEVQVWRVSTKRESLDEDTPNPAVTITFTTAGQLIRMDSGTSSFRVLEGVIEDEAPAEIYEIVNTVPLDFKLPAWDIYDRIKLGCLPATEWKKHLRDSNYSTVKSLDDQVILTLKSQVAPRQCWDAPFPLSAPKKELIPFIGLANNITPANRSILKKARAITRDETNALQAVAYLAGWVNANIKWGPKASMNQTPIETLENMRGDCSEHADLFASLARSVGFPTRHCLGLRLNKEKAIYHNWVEVNVGGAWVPIDTTVNRVGLPAGYILTARDETGDNDLVDTLPLAMRNTKLDFNVLEMVKDKHTIIPGKKKSYVTAKGDWLANFYWGFALTKPADWSGRITLSGVDLKTPVQVVSTDGIFTSESVKFTCKAGETIYRGTEGELAALERALKGNMDSYHNNEAKIIDFLDGNAIFIDYTCKVKGKSMRSQQYIIPYSERSYQITCWAPTDVFEEYQDEFEKIIASLEL